LSNKTTIIVLLAPFAGDSTGVVTAIFAVAAYGLNAVARRRRGRVASSRDSSKFTPLVLVSGIYRIFTFQPRVLAGSLCGNTEIYKGSH
jgi:hypothetical protein